MIYTLTLNPSLDYFVEVKDFEIGKTNRTSEEIMLPGGKGINVSMVLQGFGEASVALGFTAGFVGKEIERCLEERKIVSDFIRLPQGNSRINIKIKNLEGTEINGMGPEISEEEISRLYQKLEALGEGDILVLSGSAPKSVTNTMLNTASETVYEDILEQMSNKKVITVIDTHGEALRRALKFKPFLIKPNQSELSQLFEVEINTFEEAAYYAKKLQVEGAKNVLVSFAGKGALLLTEEGEIYQSPVPEGKLINAVGAGDSMVAGFLYKYIQSKDCRQAFLWAVAAGSASAYSKSFATMEDTAVLYQKLWK